MSVLKYFARNSFIRLVAYTLGIAMAFVVTPHVVRSMGGSAYGIWALVSSLSAYYLLLDFGLLRTVAKKSAESFAHNDLENVKRLYTSATVLGIATFIIVLVAGTILALLSRYMEQDAVEGWYLAISIFSFSAFVGAMLITRPAQGLLGAAMQWNFIAAVSMIRLLISSIGVLLLLSDTLSPSQNLLRVSLITGISFMIEPVMMLPRLKARLGIGFAFSMFSMGKAKELLRFGGQLFLAQTGEVLNKRTHIYIIALVVNAAQVGVFAVAWQFINYMNDVILSAFGIMNPYFSRLQAQNNKNSYQSALLDSLALCYSVSCLVALGLAFYGGLFTTRWLGENFSHIGGVLAPIAFAALLWHGETPANEFLIGLGAQKVLARLSMAQGILSTLLCYPCVYFFGMPGVGWMIFALAALFSLIIKPYYMSAISGIKLQRYYTFLLAMLLPQLAGQSLYFYFVRPFLQPEYLDVILAGCGQGVISMLILAASLKLTSSLRSFSSEPVLEGEQHA